MSNEGVDIARDGMQVARDETWVARDGVRMMSCSFILSLSILMVSPLD